MRADPAVAGGEDCLINKYKINAICPSALNYFIDFFRLYHLLDSSYIIYAQNSPTQSVGNLYRFLHRSIVCLHNYPNTFILS